ncbi:TerC family protein [Heliophilum fasciatum]|uniref:YjbE family integral membrane protein n=1 Tax=Heliophilum fasciatum TaxID=35700 RepID=A0A4R2RBQ7_9FIRM|nr:TerC family protein [Heliophilum fasciatum]MCW2279516.1 YjbE family integral membrane protein [Heliophilum fasciatum]TCP60792.1 YjbE family integral membrane protein [Heliophilum fasciatum]
MIGELAMVDFLIALASIVLFDIILGGDNAIVIALAARALPAAQRKKAIIWGTVGAVVVRIVMTLGVVYLLQIPLLQFIGGLLLVYIAFKLLRPQDENVKVDSADSFWAAVKTIVFADILLGVDNVFAIAGASHGNYLLVALGLAISIPIVVWGSTIILKWLERFPIIINIGAAVLAWTAGRMMMDDKMVAEYLQHVPLLTHGLPWALGAAVPLIGYLLWQRKAVKVPPIH